MASWPGTLPDPVLADNYSEKFPNLTIRFNVDIGPPKMRRRTTAAARTVICSQILTTAQVADLDTFFTTTTVGGADAFTWKNQRTGSTVSMRFVVPPEIIAVDGNGHYRANYQLEILP